MLCLLLERECTLINHCACEVLPIVPGVGLAAVEPVSAGGGSADTDSFLPEVVLGFCNMLAAQSDEHTKTPSTSRATLYQSAVGLIEVSKEEVRFGAPKSNLPLPVSNAGVTVCKVLGPDLWVTLKLVAQLAEVNCSNDKLFLSVGIVHERSLVVRK